MPWPPRACPCAELAILFNDPPKHTRLRRLVGAAFKPGAVEALRERITAITDKLIDGLPQGAGADGSFDLMTGLAQRLPVLRASQPSAGGSPASA